MALADYQFKYRGLTFGADQAIKVEAVEGLDDLSVAVGDIRLPRNHGAIPGLHTVNPREVVLRLIVRGDKRSQALADSVSEAMAVFASSRDTAYPLSFKEPGMPVRRINTRVIGRARPRHPGTTHGMEKIVVRMIAADPRIYADTEESSLLNPYDVGGGGADYDFDYGVDFALDTSGELTLTNGGDSWAYPRLRFYGPDSGTVTGVKVTNTTTGVVFDLDSDILTGQIIDADMRRIVAADPGDDPFISLGGSSRWGDWQLPRTPLYLVPGDNTLRFEVTGTSTDAQCVVTFRDCWL